MSSIGTKLDANVVLKQVYDEPNNRLRVDAAINATLGEVVVKDLDGDHLNINPDGSLNIAPLDVVISSTTDNIAIRNTGNTNELLINGDGSINVAGSVSGTVSVNQNGLANIATSQYTVGTSPVQLTPTPLTGRKSISIKAHMTTPTEIVYIGNSGAVTTSNGYPLFDGDSLQIDLTDASNLYVVSTSAGQKVYALELG